jgi:hypothetical protein
MAYSTATPPQLLVPSLNDQSPSIWTYNTADAGTLVDDLNYFTDALDLGMKVGDIVFVQDTDTYLTTSHVVLAVVAAGADLGDGTTIGDNTNS